MLRLAAHHGLSYCIAFFAAVAAAFAPAVSAHSRNSTACRAGYSYVGAVSPVAAAGVSARIRLSSLPAVSSGHIAAWVGVGSPKAGPGGTSEWLQTGIADIEGETSHLYYEVWRPGDLGATYVELGAVRVGDAHTFTVRELAGRSDVWVAEIDGTRVSRPVTLPGSHDAFEPVVTAENWDGGTTGACNSYDFDFAEVSMRAEPGRTWQPFALTRLLRDPAYALAVRARGFTAASR